MTRGKTIAWAAYMLALLLALLDPSFWQHYDGRHVVFAALGAALFFWLIQDPKDPTNHPDEGATP